MKLTIGVIIGIWILMIWMGILLKPFWWVFFIFGLLGTIIAIKENKK